MEEKDRELTEKILDKAISQQSELIRLQFQNLFDKLDTIDKKVTLTNGTVLEHSKLIQELKDADTKHVLNCPNSVDIEALRKQVATLEKIEIAKEAVNKFTWKQVTGIGIIAGTVLSIITLILNFLE